VHQLEGDEVAPGVAAEVVVAVEVEEEEAVVDSLQEVEDEEASEEEEAVVDSLQEVEGEASEEEAEVDNRSRTCSQPMCWDNMICSNQSSVFYNHFIVSLESKLVHVKGVSLG
jgi:hypothetical protein